MKTDEREQQLNEKVLRWKAEALSDSDRDVLRNEIFILVFQLYDKDNSLIFVETLVEALQKYDPAKGPFSHYFKFLLKKRSTDAYRQSEKHAPAAFSLDAPFPEDNGLTLMDFVEDPRAEIEGTGATVGYVYDELTAQILNFAERRTGRENNEKRRMWYRIFYTEDITNAAKSVRLNLWHERDAFSAMELAYLDYYMQKPCRTLRQIEDVPLKPYQEVVPDRSAELRDQETPIPIPADVSIAYLDLCKHIQVGKTARSNQLKFYKEEKERIISC
jgi:hypothetical protein